MNLGHQLTWLVKGTITAAIFLSIFAALTPMVVSGPEILPAEGDGEAAKALIAYHKEPTPTAVLVGTSLTYRLKEQLFLPVKVRNLAIPGRSVLNGLEIIASYPRLPASIFVETNVMVWKEDKDFVKKFSYAPQPSFQISPPIRSFVSYIDSDENKPAEEPRLDETILNQPPAEYDNKIYVQRALASWNGHQSDTTILSNVDALHDMVQKLEMRGSKVYLFELPMAGGMRETDISKTTSATFHKRFSNPSRWMTLDYPAGQLRFRDHAHLDERSAIIVAHAMRTEILKLQSFRK